MGKLMRHPKIIRLAVTIGRYFIRLLVATCRVRIKGVETLVATAQEKPCILILWHCHLTLIADILSRHTPQFVYATFVSNSRDGEPLAQLTTSYPNGRVIRVPHNARHMALKAAIEFLNTPGHILMITPDGPRGPAKRAKPGVAMAATQAQAPLVPFSWKSNRQWKFRTWDQLQLPKPFSTIEISFGKPFTLNPQSTLKEKTDQINDHLNNQVFSERT